MVLLAFNVFTKCVHKLKQRTTIVLHDENYTSFIISLLVYKMGVGRAVLNLADRRSAYSKGCSYKGGGALIRGFTIYAHQGGLPYQKGLFIVPFRGRIQNMEWGLWITRWTWSMDHPMDPVHGPSPLDHP